MPRRTGGSSQEVIGPLIVIMPPDNGMQPKALHAAADVERYAYRLHRDGYRRKLSTMSPTQLEEILSLSVEERIQLVEAVWDSIAQHPESLPVTEAQRKELDRRLADHLKDPQAARPWSQVRDSLARKK